MGKAASPVGINPAPAEWARRVWVGAGLRPSALGGDIAFIYTRASREILERAQKALGSSDAGSLAAELIEAVSRLEDEPADGADDDDGADVDSAYV